MSKRTFYALSCLILSVFVLSPSAFAQSCRLGLGEDGDLEIWLEGTIGDAQVRVYFSTEPDGQLTGSFYDVHNWSPILFEGIRGDDCKYRILEAGKSRPGMVWEGTFKGTIKNRVFEGTRRDSVSGESAAIRLQRVTPMECDGKGKWIRATVPEFAISFEYPENWRIVDRSEKTLRLQCPDPRAMQFSGTGVSVDSVGGPELTSIGRFSKPQGTWLVSGADIGGPCESSTAFCEDARVSRQSGMTVVYGSGSTRLYVSGGSYQGTGDEESYLLLLKDRALYVSSVFVKENTTAKIVRSVKPLQ
jgi:hypothetical protein